MIETKKLSDDYSVAAQITTDDLPLISAMGFKSVICNRPDGEDMAQQLFEDIERAATNVGIKAVYLPIWPTGPMSEDIEAFAKAYESMPKPIFAYCRSGARSGVLLAAMQAQQA